MTSVSFNVLHWGHVFIITVLCSTILFLLSFVPLSARIERSGFDRTDILLHNGFMPDYAVYLATITMGQHGKFYFRNYFSPTETTRLPIHFWYLTVGLLTGWINLWPPYAYHLGRFLTTIAFGISLLLFTKSLFKSPALSLAAIVLILFIPIAPMSWYSTNVAETFMPWWRDWLEIVERIDIPPHHLAAQSFLLLSLASFITWKKKKLARYRTSAIICSIASSLMVPHTILPFIGVIGLDTAVTATLKLIQKQIKALPSVLLNGVLFLIPSFITLVGLSILLGSTTWGASRDWEVAFWNRDPLFYYHLYLSFFILLAGSIPAIITTIKTQNRERMYLILWSAIPLLIAPFLDHMGAGKSRLFQTVIHIPLACLTILSIKDILSHAPKLGKYFIACILIVLATYAGFRIFSYSTFSKNRILSESYDWRYYIPTTYYQAAAWIAEHIPNDTGLIAREDIANWIVSFAPVVVYAGDQTHGYNWDRNLTSLSQFYAQEMTDIEAKNYLVSKNIQYAVDEFYGDRFLLTQYSFLKPVWENDNVRILKVE